MGDGQFDLRCATCFYRYCAAQALPGLDRKWRWSQDLQGIGRTLPQRLNGLAEIAKDLPRPRDSKLSAHGSPRSVGQNKGGEELTTKWTRIFGMNDAEIIYAGSMNINASSSFGCTSLDD